ncbi:hypothetical protein HPP92_016507 [Vanilla planifolia]|uniref:MADS-box domain-containing protein n=1 Tax=Vanilla planifolia TaxID=51239 RepID=A0A835URW7_VANPL|nr:hypothetical protein HPP92_017095 [Vanilla planifolia]KAG0471961.1 hypothetical protein HPP92_016507 [Vanilla planifolia]
MARKKVKLEWIPNDAARRATFKKRRKGLLKKVAEISTLCDVKACLVVYGPCDPNPEVWPSPQEATRVLAKLRRLPEMEQNKKMMNQEGFMRHRIAKLEEQLRKQDRDNRELETTLLMNQALMGRSLQDVEMKKLTSLAWLVEMKTKEIQRRLDSLRAETSAKVAVTTKTEVKKEVEAGPQGKERTPMEAAMEELQKQEWFSEMMNSHEEMMSNVPFLEHGSNGWLDAYFPIS